MHYIQRKIFDKLIYNKQQSYSQMRPIGIESNHYAYHLKQLLKENLIEKDGKAYRLSTKGKAYVDTISYMTLEFRAQPKIITMLNITNKKGETVLYRRKNQPYIDMVGYPTGKVHLGETISEAVLREAKEKLGLEKINPKHRGMVYIGISEKGELISQVLAHVFEMQYDEELPEVENRRAEVFWGDAKKVSKQETFIPGFFDIKKLLESDGLFFEEFNFTL